MELNIDGYVSESRNAHTKHIDTAATEEILKMINSEDAMIAPAIEKQIPVISACVDAITARINSGGRLLYVGGGTSGRIGVLDAAEVSPYFNVPYEMVQGLIAGGDPALKKVLPGVEDDDKTVLSELEEIGLQSNDAVFGISSSGSTPYVRAALEYAKSKGALTLSLVNNAASVIGELSDHEILLELGAEVLTGATAFKAGTATKMILNMVSTAVMIKLGRVYSNLQLCVEISNAKLVQRVSKALMEAADIDSETAGTLLELADNHAAVALIMHTLDTSVEEAKKIYNDAKGNIRLALQQQTNSATPRIPAL
jgi:N-acetylmuramic acid 6-phosphate etherase